MAASTTTTRDQTAKVRYFTRNPPKESLDENGVHTLGEVTKNISRDAFIAARHSVTEPHDMLIRDARAVPGGLESFTLEKNGFMCIQVPELPAGAPEDRRVVKEQYWPQILELAKKTTGAFGGFVMSYSWRTGKGLSSSYARFAHTDAGPDNPDSWRRAFINRGMPEEEAKSCDICMFQIWHPYDHPAWKNPLCLLDFSSLKSLADDTVRYRYRGSNDTGADATNAPPRKRVVMADGRIQGDPFYALGPVHNPDHRWYYISDQKPREAWLFKQYDTRDLPGVARASFHTAFYDPFHDKNSDTPNRHSCEFRLLLALKKDTPQFGSRL